ncbi:MAG: BrnT family toxin [Candidatus Levybacteria bacterium]|nr:BrnT family toxin [Candidatus Levybacteria bacterium]
MNTSFEWDDEKNARNLQKHGVDFRTAQYAFLDPKRVIARDALHSKAENRYYVFGKVKGGVLTVRFTYRKPRIRIIGAGYWRKGRKIYEKENQIQ